MMYFLIAQQSFKNILLTSFFISLDSDENKNILEIIWEC